MRYSIAAVDDFHHPAGCPAKTASAVRIASWMVLALIFTAVVPSLLFGGNERSLAGRPCKLFSAKVAGDSSEKVMEIVFAPFPQFARAGFAGLSRGALKETLPFRIGFLRVEVGFPLVCRAYPRVCRVRRLP